MHGSTTIRRRRAGVALGALAVVMTLSACSDGAGAEEKATGAQDGAALGELPESIGDLHVWDVECESIDEDNRDQCLENAAGMNDVAEAAAENLAAAHDGAATRGGAYTSAGFEQLVQVYAVAAPSPGLWSMESDTSAARARLAHPTEWVEEADGAQCYVHTKTAVPEGETWTEDNAIPTLCQATDDGLTVILRPAPNSTVTDALDWTRQAFEGLS